MVRVKEFVRFKVYSPNGGLLGVLDDPQDWRCSFPLSDVSALNVDVDLLGADGALLSGMCELAVEVQNDAGEWVEPVNGRYLRVDVARDSAAGEAGLLRVSAVGYASLLDGVVVVPKKLAADASFYDEDGKRKFLSANPGQVLATILSEARGVVDGLIPGLELGFTPSRDSRGRPWKSVDTFYVEPGTSMLSVLQMLSDRGFVEWWFEGRRLMVANPVEGTPAPSKHLIPLGASEAPVRSTIGGLLHTALLVGDAGNVWRVDNPGAPTPWGKTMRVLTQGGVKLESTARKMIQAELDAGSRERFEYTWQKPVAGLGWTPLVDVRPGDWVSYKTPQGFQAVRVFQVVLSGTGKDVRVALTLNDRFEDAQVRQSKRIKGIVNGAHGDAGTGSLPTRADKAEPAAPTGLVAESEGYWEGDEPRSLVRVGFAPVTLDVHGLAITVDHYEVNVAGKVTNTAEHSNVVLDGLAPNKGVAISVVAVSRDGVRSVPAVGRVTTVQPDEKLAPPTQLVGDSDYGIVSLDWDGKLKYPGGQPYAPPAHFARVEVEESTDYRSWKLVGSFRSGGLVLNRQDAVGRTRYYRAWSVDRLGRRSDTPSPTTTMQVESKLRSQIQAAQQEVVDELSTAEIDISRLARRPGNTFKNGVIEALVADRAFARELVSRKILVGIPGNPVKSVGIADGAVTADKLVADRALIRKIMTEELMAGVVTSHMFSTNAGFRGDHIDIDRYGITATDSSGNRTFTLATNGTATFSGNITSRATIEGATIVGATIKTRKSGARLEMNGNNLISYDYSSRKNMQITPYGQEFWYQDRKIGFIGTQHRYQHPDVRGISNKLDYQGDYISWSYEETPNPPYATSMLTLDPKGRFDDSGCQGIYAGIPFFAKAGLGIVGSRDGAWRFHLQTSRISGEGTFPAIQWKSGSDYHSKIIFGEHDIWLGWDGRVFSMRTALAKLGF